MIYIIIIQMYSNNNNNSNKNMSRNSFQRTNKPAVAEEFSLNSVLFPELPDNNDKDSNDKNSNDKDSNSVINYKSILLMPVPENFIPFIRVKEKTDAELELAKKRIYHNDACKVIDIMSKKWLDFRLNYIEMWGEDEYERWYISLNDWDKAIFGEEEEEDDDYESTDDEENCDY